ncbi:MAG: protein kinase, partial [Candidatus Chloroheliales bacterium]
ALALLNLASVARFQGNYPRANELFSECLPLMRQVGDRNGLAQTLAGLANVAYQQGNLAHAAALHKESLIISQELDYKLGEASALEGLASVATAQEQPERGARLFGAAAALRDAIKAPLHPTDRSEHERGVMLLRQRLGEAVFSRLWAEGQALALSAAIEYALSGRVLDSASSPSR